MKALATSSLSRERDFARVAGLFRAGKIALQISDDSIHGGYFRSWTIAFP